MIKTTIAGEALTRALAKQQRWVDRHRTYHQLHELCAQCGVVRPCFVHEGTTTVDNAVRAKKLRMAKARLRSSVLR